jgi:hypothetical protein
MQSHSIPLNRFCVPELRCFDVQLHGHMQWILAYFEDIYRSEQLEQFTLFNQVELSKDVDLPTANVLYRWLTMKKSKQSIVRLDLFVIDSDTNKNRWRALYNDYKEIFGEDCVNRRDHIFIRFPITYINNRAKLMNIVPTQEDDDYDDPVDEAAKEVRNKSK